MLYNVFLEYWITTREKLKLQSTQKYQSLIDSYLKNGLGLLNIKKISENHIKDFFNLLDTKKVACSVQKTLLYIIKNSLFLAIEEKKRKFLDLSKISIANSKKQIDVLGKNEQKTLESFILAKPNIRRICVLLCLYTGLRIGEVCGLKWEDINFSNNTLIVKRTILRVKNPNGDTPKTILIESDPKSYSSVRTIPIHPFIMSELLKYKSNNEFYILSKSLKKYDPRIMEDSFSRMLKRCNIRHVNFHVLRHTFATRCIEAKVDIKTLSELLGHSSIEITLKTYVHSSTLLKEESINNLFAFMQTA